MKKNTLNNKLKTRKHSDLESRIETRSLQKASEPALNLILANLESAYYAVTQGPDIGIWKENLYGNWYENVAWFYSDNDEVFSFNWCVDHLENNGSRIPRERIVDKVEEWANFYEKTSNRIKPKLVPILDLTVNL